MAAGTRRAALGTVKEASPNDPFAARPDTYSVLSQRRSTITSPFAPDFAELRSWLEEAIRALRFVEIVTAVIALVTRMQGINVELTRQVSQLRRRRPRSETLERLERQLLLPFLKMVKTTERPANDDASDTEKPKPSRRGKHPGRARVPGASSETTSPCRATCACRWWCPTG